MTQKILPSLSIFFPVYRDEHTVEALTRACVAVARELTDDFEILIVDDKSPDRAGEIAENMAREFKEVSVLHHDVNQGVGQAMIDGFNRSRKEYVFYTDGDFQYDVKELLLLAQHVKDYDVVIGYRLKRVEGLKRVFVSRCFHFMISSLLGVHSRDIDCSFKLMHRRFLDQVTFHTQSALVDTELLINARRLKFPVKEVGVHHYARRFGGSQCLRIKLILSMIKDVFHLRRIYRA